MDKGGQAFPTPGSKYENGIVNHPESGMSLRDYFAGQALAGFTSNMDRKTRSELANGIIAGGPLVTAAYVLADTMITIRRD